jgi:hypothetical protein
MLLIISWLLVEVEVVPTIQAVVAVVVVQEVCALLLHQLVGAGH